MGIWNRAVSTVKSAGHTLVDTAVMMSPYGVGGVAAVTLVKNKGSFGKTFGEIKGEWQERVGVAKEAFSGDYSALAARASAKTGGSVKEQKLVAGIAGVAQTTYGGLKNSTTGGDKAAAILGGLGGAAKLYGGMGTGPATGNIAGVKNTARSEPFSIDAITGGPKLGGDYVIPGTKTRVPVIILAGVALLAVILIAKRKG